MTISPDSESASTSEANTQITQDIDKNQALAISQMMGGLVANQVTINVSSMEFDRHQTSDYEAGDRHQTSDYEAGDRHQTDDYWAYDLISKRGKIEM
jgi:hypothetical protein